MSQFTENIFWKCSFQYRRIYTVGKLFHSFSVQLSLVLYSTPFPLFRKYLQSPIAKKQRRNIDTFPLMMHPSNCHSFHDSTLPNKQHKGISSVGWLGWYSYCNNKKLLEIFGHGKLFSENTFLNSYFPKLLYAFDYS